MILVGVFVIFSDDSIVEYDHTGIVHDIRSSANGFTFYLDTSDGKSIKCFFKEEPVELGHYGVVGDQSDDGSMFFVSFMKDFDICR